MSMMEKAKRDRLADNWNSVVQDVAQAATDAGRDPDSVCIIGVTKYVDATVTAAVCDAGCRHLGENRPQVLWEKAETMTLDSVVQWHLIGHLQRNKVRRVLRHHPIIHSIDSQRLLAAVADESQIRNTQNEEPDVPVLLEVNISGEDAKTGMSPELIAQLVGSNLPVGIRVIGIMAMAGWGTQGDLAQAQFAAARELRDRLESETGQSLPELSMGMSGDFREAIAEGATMVRIGSRLYEGVVDLTH